MSWIDKETGEIKFTLKEKQDYHNAQAKLGATKFDKKTHQIVKVSDFERGAHKAKADMIFEQRKRFAIQKANPKPKQKSYNQKIVKGVPAWYSEYKKQLDELTKNKKQTSKETSTESLEELEELRTFFKNETMMSKNKNNK